jgi:hypothetical protein
MIILFRRSLSQGKEICTFFPFYFLNTKDFIKNQNLSLYYNRLYQKLSLGYKRLYQKPKAMFFPCYFLTSRKKIHSCNTSKHLLLVTILFSRREVNDFLTELRHFRDERLPSPFFFHEPSHLLDVMNKIRRSSHSLGL